MKKRIFSAVAVAFIAGMTWGVIYLDSLLPIITGYSAKYLCSAVFISNRLAADVEAADLRFSFIQYVKNEINYRDKTVTSHFLWGQSKAIYREGFGSTLLCDADEDALREKKNPFQTGANFNQDTIAWPLGNIIPDTNTGIDKVALNGITQKLIVENGYNGNAFGFIVIHRGIPATEKYKQGFNEKTRFLSWSMAKSFTNALAGIMVKDGKLDIQQPADIAAWQNDDRKRITINNLMQMQSGQRWNEDYGNRSDVTLMLYNNKDFAGFAYNQPLEFPPGSHWYYSSGSTNIVNYLMRKQFNGDSAYWDYAYTRLFNKIGTPDVVFEVDPTGTQVGSSYIYATARDYARFGLLYLQNGIFNGERLLPEGWIRYTTTPATHSKGSYGSFFWLNRGKYYPSAPEDMYSCNGHDGQRIFIIPSKDLIIVVLGYSPKPDNEMNFNQLLKDILGTLSQGKVAK
jgi:CubicO group peptidase (beta-lactamase class C family)